MRDKNPGFSSTEIVEIGVEIEKNGMGFYSELTGKFKYDHIKEFFSQMADEERQHIEDFKGILSSLQDYEPSGSYPDEYFSYLNAIASQFVFDKTDELKERIKAISSEDEALDVSIGLEKDSILFYTEMKKVLPEGGQEIVDKIISQERGHVEKLWSLKKRH